MVLEIAAYKTYFEDNDRTNLYLTSGSVSSTPDYSIMMVSENEWELYQGSTSMTIDPATYSSAPHVAKIVLTQSLTAITSCKYYVNGVEVTPSFSFAAVGDIDKTGHCFFPSANNSAQNMITTTGKWTLNTAGAVISTTTNEDDTVTKTTSGDVYVDYVDESPVSSGGTFLPPPPAMVRL